MNGKTGDQVEFLDLMERAGHARSARRNFIRLCGGAAVMTGGLSLLAACGDDNDDDPSAPTPTPTPPPATGATELDVLNFALQLEYLEANYYLYAVTGSGLSTTLQTGTGTLGSVIPGSGAGAARAVTFSDPIVREYAREIAADEVAHVTFLRNAIGSSLASAQPSINISGSATVTLPTGTGPGAFTAAARAAGIIGNNEIFDPYANDESFLIGAYILSDVGVTAYRGSARLITTKAFLEAASGILATEAYHDGVIRSELWSRGLTVPSIYSRIQRISDYRDGLDGPVDTDQSIGNEQTANLVPTLTNGLVPGRTASQVLNVVYGNAATGTSSGGFFPAGVNGFIRTTVAPPTS